MCIFFYFCIKIILIFIFVHPIFKICSFKFRIFWLCRFFSVFYSLNFIFYIIHYLSHFSNAIMISLGVIAVALMVVSRGIKRRSILLERLFVNNLRSRDIEAQVHGKKRPLYEGRLLDRDIHIADFDVPSNSLWMGSTLKELNLGKRYGVHISSILRGGFRMNIPDGDYMLYPGDRLQVIGSDEQLAKFGNALANDVIKEDLTLENREMKRSIYSCMVVGLEEGKENLSAVNPKRRFEEGDILWIVGEQESLNSILNA